MWKFYKLQLIVMSPLLLVGVILITPIYYLFKLISLKVLDESHITLEDI